MADIKISELPTADQANIDDLLEASQVSGPGYVTRHISLDQVATVVADSTQITDLVDDAIGEIPPLTWDNIVDKPATFPPTVPIAWADISGEPDFNALYVNVAGDTMTGPLIGTSVTMSGSINSTGSNITTQGGYVMVDRVGDAAAGQMFIRTDVGFNAAYALMTGTATRWNLLKNSTAEGGSNAGSDFQIYAYNDAGAGIGAAATFTRSTLATTLGGALTGTTATFNGNVTFPTQTPGTNNTTGATTAFVTAALAAGASISVGTTPPGSPAANQLWWNTDAAVGGGAMYIYYDSFWVPASPGVGSGAVVQTVSYQTGAVATGTTIMPVDDTIPQITEGFEVMTLAITPRSATSRLIIEVTCMVSHSAAVGQFIAAALFQDATANALATNIVASYAAGGAFIVSFRHTMIAGTTSATTFRVRCGAQNAGTLTFNGTGGGRAMGGVLASSIVIQEVL